MFNCGLIFPHIGYLVYKVWMSFFILLLWDAQLLVSDCEKSALFCVLCLYLRITRASLHVFQTGVQCRDMEVALHMLAQVLKEIKRWKTPLG